MTNWRIFFLGGTSNVRKHNPDIHVTVADFGLTHSGKHWAETNADKVLTYERHPKYAWFYKPTAMVDCPYEYTCWLDLDCEVLKPVDEIFNFPTDEKMALTQDVVRSGNPSGATILEYFGGLRE